MSGVGAGVGSGAGGLVQLPQLQHAAAMAAANHLYEYQAAAAQGAAAYQQQYAAAGFDPYATAAGKMRHFILFNLISFKATLNTASEKFKRTIEF